MEFLPHDQFFHWLFFHEYTIVPSTFLVFLYLSWQAHKSAMRYQGQPKQHRHRPKVVEDLGVNRYLICECGSKRVQRGTLGYSPVLAGWSDKWDTPPPE